MTGFAAYDLQPPARILYPGCGHDRADLRTRTLHLDPGNPVGAYIETVTWTGCRPSCREPEPHPPDTVVRLIVPCTELPHCHACECDDTHRYTLTPGQADELKGMLP